MKYKTLRGRKNNNTILKITSEEIIDKIYDRKVRKTGMTLTNTTYKEGHCRGIKSENCRDTCFTTKDMRKCWKKGKLLGQLLNKEAKSCGQQI
jgi:hypothetical protein